MRKLLLLLFRPDVFEAIYYPLSADELVIRDLAAFFDISEAAVIEHAARHAGVDYSMDEFFVSPVLPWQIRQWIRKHPIDLTP